LATNVSLPTESTTGGESERPWKAPANCWRRQAGNLRSSENLAWRFFSAGSPDELAAAIGAHLFHLVATGATERALIGANKRLAFVLERAATFLARRFHDQGHRCSSFCQIRPERLFSQPAANEMHTATSIIMHAPRPAIFETAANLELWPKILPHYRYIRYLERGADRNVVVMAAVRSGIPISWTSEQIIDREKFEVRFHHLKSLTKGMHVVWTFQQTADGVFVEIEHDLNFRVPALARVAEKIIGGFFIQPVAGRTLRCMKAYLEGGEVGIGSR
jgi:ribosome-associated toxin RatA of RatAB toxin-antitoxin module